MKARLLLSVLVLAVLVPLATPARGIVGGDFDGDGHPNVAIIVGDDAQGHGIFFCTGTLISPTVVVTAAHCAGGEDFGQPVAEYRVGFHPTLAVDSSGRHVLTDYIVGTAHFDPHYVDGTINGTSAFEANSGYDLGVIVLSHPASDLYPGIQPAVLPAKGALDTYRTGTRNRFFTNVGYGAQRSGPPGQADSQFYDFTRRVTTSALQKISDWLLFQDGNPNDARGGGGLCAGDSGGPVFDAGVLVAVHSFGSFPTCQNTNGSVRLDTDRAHAFLSPYLP